MGLDSVELIMAVEEAFGISNTDEEAGKVITVADFYDLVRTKLRGMKTDRCLTSAAFYRVRRGFVEGLGMTRREITPALVLDTVLPRPGRRQKWRNLQNAARIEIPDLEFSRLTSNSLVGLTILLAATFVLGVRLFGGTQSWIFMVSIAIIGLVGIALLLSKLFAPFAVAFPYQAVTVGDLAKGVLGRNHAQLAAAIGGYNDAEAWEALLQVIVSQTGVDRGRVRPGARIVKDLGVD